MSFPQMRRRRTRASQGSSRTGVNARLAQDQPPDQPRVPSTPRRSWGSRSLQDCLAVVVRASFRQV
jgi:hypothetical protein